MTSLQGAFNDFLRTSVFPRLVLGLKQHGCEVTINDLAEMLNLPASTGAVCSTPKGSVPAKRCAHIFERGGTKNEKGTQCSNACVKGLPVCAVHMKCKKDIEYWLKKGIRFPAPTPRTPKGDTVVPVVVEAPVAPAVMAPAVMAPAVMAPAVMAPAVMAPAVVQSTMDDFFSPAEPTVDVAMESVDVPQSPTAEERGEESDADSRAGDL